MATLTHRCDKEQTIQRTEERVASFTRLRAEDINTFYNKDINKIQKDAFSENDLIAGAEILRAFSQELKFGEKDSIFFARYAIDALPIGYLIQHLEKRSG